MIRLAGNVAILRLFDKTEVTYSPITHLILSAEAGL